MNLNQQEQAFWDSYLRTLSEKPDASRVEAGIAGDVEIADELLSLYLSGRKTAGSSLLKDYEYSGEDLPEPGDYWIILDSRKHPRCIVRTVRVEVHRFDEVPKEVAIAEGEGDRSLSYWRQAHSRFFASFLRTWGVTDLSEEQVVTEFYELVFKCQFLCRVHASAVEPD